MNKPHTTLKTSTNVYLIFAWGVAVVILLSFLNPWPIPILVAGVVLGLAGGVMQVLSFNESKGSFKGRRTMIEVRKALKNTKWGKRYIAFLWAGNFLLVVIAFMATNNPMLSVMVGYFLLMFIREIITLKSTIELNSTDCDNIA